jgi:hypothetical protein
MASPAGPAAFHASTPAASTERRASAKLLFALVFLVSAASNTAALRRFNGSRENDAIIAIGNAQRAAFVTGKRVTIAVRTGQDVQIVIALPNGSIRTTSCRRASGRPPAAPKESCTMTQQ